MNNIDLEEKLKEIARHLNHSLFIGETPVFKEGKPAGHGYKITSSGSKSTCERIAEVLGGHVYKNHQGAGYHWQIAKREQIERTVPVIMPFLNKDRQDQITLSMRDWKVTEGRAKPERGVSILKDSKKPVAYTRKFVSPFAIS